MAEASDDVFGDDSDIDDIATTEWDRLRQSRIKDGYRSGFESGQESTLQAGFNKGYCEGVHISYQINYIKGLLSALKAYHEQTEHHVFSAADRDTITDMLQELETLEHSQNAMLQTQSQQSLLQTSSNKSAGESQTSDAIISEEDGNGGSKMTQISQEFEDMHIEQDVDILSQRGAVSDDIGAQKGAISERLAELSRQCRTLFAQLDIQNLLQ
ncbi:uncharacterized protein [Amphiura filiformis]|uniref:uncharacterized protein n=1 Tax=Amphiura filiformis TaxID=82378 RepID=UPI003B223F55